MRGVPPMIEHLNAVGQRVGLFLTRPAFTPESRGKCVPSLARSSGKHGIADEYNGASGFQSRHYYALDI
jgi:hypothetical protein